ncbi:hypothetical protein T10_5842 [Trichinella papuae]|uniref:Uncharacterized protein n=1 Tax=Trichinella papuae TaxID=268474 RepID=A0A0V1MEZ4_9BILA|nr:hypothetical protein T10_5842 [Trichinella papuae]
MYLRLVDATTAVSKVIAQKGSSVKVGFSLVYYDCKENAKNILGKLSTAEKHELKLFHTAVSFLFFDYELGRHAAKLPCALLHYVIDASCCTSSIEISCCVFDCASKFVSSMLRIERWVA